MSSCVLDASALIAYLRGEPGADEVEVRLGAGAAMSTVNWSEVLGTVAARGASPDGLVARLEARGLFGKALALRRFTEDDALEAARLRPRTRAHGLSLADRACIALALRLGVPAVTADRRWVEAQLPVPVELVR